MSTMHSREASLRKKKQELAARSRRRRALGIAAVALAAVLTVGGTVAFLVASTGPVTNTFTPANVSTEIEEGFDGTTKSNVRVENKSDIPVYVRAKVVINWVDAAGNVVTSVPEGYSYTMNPTSLPANSEWVLGADGFWYYTVALTAFDNIEEAGTDQTKNLIYSIVVTKGGNDFNLSVQILTEAIQASGTTTDASGNEVSAVVDAWSPTVSGIDGEGILILVTASTQA